MEDREIVRLYFERNLSAIEETVSKYKNYCTSIAVNILGNSEDAEECVNDTFHNAWNSIPPHKPDNLATYLGKIIRNLSFDRYKKNRAKKRGGGEIAAVLDELSGCVSGKESPESEIDRKELLSDINKFLGSISKDKCKVFVLRYWHAMGISEIAEKSGKSETNISVMLSRIRGELKSYLTERGHEL